MEVVARDLRASKGSFYWHFRDRADLLDKMLSHWEEGELGWLNAHGEDTSGAIRWAKLIKRTADPDRVRMEVALRSWAREDEHVATRVAALEKRKASAIAHVLQDIGFARPAAEYWSEMVLLVCLGWLDRTTRDPQFQLESRSLGELLSEVILAASSRTTATNS